MKKFLFLFSFFLLAVSNLYAGEKTITISRNDVAWESANTVYNVTKGGVELVMSGGMNNPNFLLMKQHTTITVKSHNFNIKRIVFHCLDNYTNDNLDVFYWGPTTLSIQYSQTHAERAGTLTQNYQGSTYDALWVSTKSSSPGNYPNGLPAGYELMFENQGKPVRFASIDIVVEQEVGDIYELVTSQSEVQAGQTYILVGRQYSTSTTGRALSVNETSETPSGNPTRTSTPVELLENGYRVKATGDVQLIKLEATGNSTRPYYLKMGSNYLRRRSGGIDGSGNNIGTNLYGVSSLSSYETDLANYYRTSITINGAATYYNALIRFGHLSSETEAPTGGVTRTFAIRHRNSSGYFRDLDYSSNNGDAQYQRVYLYKPAKQYKVTTEVKPNAADGAISLRDGILVEVVNNETVNYSQKMDTVQFLVTAAEGKKIASIDIQALDDNNQVVDHIAPLTTSQTINGTLYTFVMPGHDVNIVATFADVEYHNINMLVKPSAVCGNIFITEGYVVQNDQVKSYDGQNVVFNVTPNPINPANESEGYYELINVTLTDNVTGVETVLVPDANGNYTFTMPDNEVTITANFRAKLMISTACEPNNGGYFEQSTMTCNGQGTNFYNGAQYYFGDVMTFMVKTNYGYKINKVIVTDGYGSETTLTPTSSYNDGNFYSFSMPNSNVTITAYFYEAEDDLYLIGEANGGDWAPDLGKKFSYDADNSRYYLKVYFKGTGEYGGNADNAFNTFNLTKKLATRPGFEGGWDDIANDRLGYTSYTEGGELISDGVHKALATGYDYKENKFKIPAGIYIIYVNRAKTEMWVEIENVSLTFEPAGGTADSPEVVSKGTTVTLAGDVYSQIKAINPDEANANFKYKAVKIIGENVTTDEPVASTTTATTTLTEVNDGETVTELHGYNYLGWIVADNTAFYKVINTPLSWIEENGTPGKTYTVADKLLIVWTPEEHADNPCADYGKTFWAKDLPTTEKPGGLSIDATYPEEGQVDYMMLNEYTARPDGWDQSNWIELDLSDVPNHGAAIGKYIAAGTLKGEYTSDLNYKMKVTSLEFTEEEDDYEPNTFCTANFLENNLMLTPESTGPQGPSENYYFFLNPKVQEYARITYAKWDIDNQEFVVPSFGNAGEFSGALKIGGWDYNIKTGEEVIAALDNNASNPNVDPNLEYEFRAIIHRENYNYGHNPNVSVGTREQQSSNNITVWPIDLQATSNVITTVNDVNVSKAVSNVKYYNITGVESNKPFDGVNIVVTRYSDGTISTTKVLR